MRAMMKAQDVDAFICGSADAHQSEYVSDRDARRQYLSGFRGSAGTAVVLADKALLWTDGRYFLQATIELTDEWTLMRSGNAGVLEMEPWLTTHLSAGAVVGVDGSLISAEQASSLSAALEKSGVFLKSIPNPVDELWEQQPDAPMHPALVMEAHGQPHEEKIAAVQVFLKARGADAFCASMLDEIAWLFNIRGSDVKCNPVVISYAVIMSDGAHFFCNKGKLGEDVVAHLAGEDASPQSLSKSKGKRKRDEVSMATHVHIHPYEDIQKFLESLVSCGKRVAVDRKQINWDLFIAAGGVASALAVTSPLTMAKSLKNEIELNGIRAAHIRDGVALTAFLHWLDGTVRTAPGTLTEYEAAAKLETFRHAMPGHKYPSFDTIAGYGSNGAIIHYKPEKATAAFLGTDSFFLLDSGGQYIDGTTDVTRTNHYGTPTQRMIDCYTSVLKGHIALARLVFPEGTLGSRIDAAARIPLWEMGLDYNHGTGHGVGAFLNVHEGPQGIGFRKRDNEEGFKIGMTTSNEPGYYEDGAFGIRIENVCITVEKLTANHFGGRKFCCFETVTMTPISTSLINRDMLSPEEKCWLNTYHKECREKLLPGMQTHFPQAVSYLLNETEPI